MNDKSPQTIEELVEWYEANELPPSSVTRFFIGINYKNPKAFGIYKDPSTNNFIVYKNKADGTRAVRYEGQDEAYAVNEIYQRIKEEIFNQKNNGNMQDEVFYEDKKRLHINLKQIVFGAIIFIGIILVFFSTGIIKSKVPNGYYLYGGEYFYHQGYTWYRYSSYSGWKESQNTPKELKKNYNSYYTSSNYDSGYKITDFKESGFYNYGGRHRGRYYDDDDDYYYDDDYDSWWDSSSSSSWDSGSSSWDSSSTDWDSNW